MSHDNRFPKTNYLKTNLLKQIKKISLSTPRVVLIFFISVAKLQKKTIRSKLFCDFLHFSKKKNTKIGVIR